VTKSDPTIIALVRHGETEWNRQHRWQGRKGVGLNEFGRRQAAAAIPLLSETAWCWMVTSPLERARQTAQIIADGLPEVPISDDDGVIERAYGEAEGVLATEASLRWPDGQFPGMETDAELKERGARALRRIISEHSGNGIVIAHGSLIRCAISELCGIDAPQILNGSVSLVRPDSDRWELLDVNRVTGPALVEGPLPGRR
jgi:uncharacterized phosphatase